MNRILVLAGTLALAFFAAPVQAQIAAPSALEWAVAQGAGGGGFGALVQPVRPAARMRRQELRGPVQTMIAAHVCERIGCAWSQTALRIAHIESRFRCNARNGRAVGVFQNTNPQMFGVSRAAALTCDGGVRAGVAHMAMCIGKGARTASQMMVCHNAGTPFARRVERAYRFALRN